MKRITSHFVFVSPDEILRNTVIERNETNTVTQIFNLNDLRSESANTLFFDGIISSDVISLKEKNWDITPAIKASFHYLDVSSATTHAIIPKTDLPLLIDFGTENHITINLLLKSLAPFLSEFSIFEIIAACTYFPKQIIHQYFKLNAGESTPLIQWKNCDLLNKKLTQTTQIAIV